MKVLAKRGVTVQIKDEIFITFDSSNSETGQITLEIPLKVSEGVTEGSSYRFTDMLFYQ